ncbi:class II aldolase/adducin family protein [Actinomadura macrotermitis]|uniref:L-ribulose-5-phosphate 4-epimerase UlaF n=1 Tax=Actinomadura macrotermitis TaxID=2585200 RepID=A0A7K0C8H3_9ACTN|nr:class II aldolase/adducin family protein [Actinomadura macrotermitis]MQY09673.1 L-ribulose-5-phosphate 4-epimerase UlaF [Actinomadura macrotermitis]
MKQSVLQAGRVLAMAGHGDMVWGHVAVRDPGGRGIWIKAPGRGLEEVQDRHLQLVSFDAEVLEGAGTPHIEAHIHLEIMRRNPAVTCTVHSHAQAAVAFAALGTPLLPISHDGALFAGQDVPRFTATGALVSTAALGRALADTLGGAPAALMPRHGLVAAGAGVHAAVMHAVLLERACRVQLTAMAAGPVRDFSDPAEAEAKRRQCWSETQLKAGWDYLLRQAERGAQTAADLLPPSP